MVRLFMLSLLAVVAAGSPGRSQEADLTWRFPPGRTFHVELSTTTRQDAKVSNPDVVQNQKMTRAFSWTPVEIDTVNHRVVLRQKFVGLKTDIDIGGSKFTYDSSAPGPANPLDQVFEALKETDFRITVDTKSMTVTDIQGHDEFARKIISANPNLKPLFDGPFSKQAMQDLAAPLFAVMPAMPGGRKKMGDSWERTSSFAFGLFGLLDLKQTFTYCGPDSEGNQIVKFKGAGRLVPLKAPAGGPFRIKEADLKTEDASGEVIIDSNAGMVKSCKLNLTIGGNLTLEIGQQPTEVQLKQKQTTDIIVTRQDAPPPVIVYYSTPCPPVIVYYSAPSYCERVPVCRRLFPRLGRRCR